MCSGGENAHLAVRLYKVVVEPNRQCLTDIGVTLMSQACAQGDGLQYWKLQQRRELT